MYQITESKIIIENEEYTVYGIRGETVCIKDVSADKAKVQELIDRCNAGNLAECHLRDVVEDFIYLA